MPRILRLRTALLGGAAAGLAGYVGLVTGRVTIDLGLARRTRPLGPIVVDIAAPREQVYAAAVAPYAERRPRAMAEKVDVLERSDQMVLAAHRTSLPVGLTSVTVETVTFDPPRRVRFRLLRGPVPYVRETFDLEETATGTRLRYTGELGTDLGRLGAAWGDVVARAWEATVRGSLDTIKSEAERRVAKPPR
jgi:hypothetical protein